MTARKDGAVPEEVIQRGQTAQAPSPALLVAALVEFVPHHHSVVHPDGADLVIAADSPRAIDVTRPDSLKINRRQ